MPTPTPTCPKCHSKNVKAGSIWRLGSPPAVPRGKSDAYVCLSRAFLSVPMGATTGC
jgi:hypothetical protein